MRLQFRVGSGKKSVRFVKYRSEIRETFTEVSVAPACLESLLQNISLATPQKEP